MKSDAYWSKRFDQLNEAQLNKGEAYIQTMNREYEKAIASIQRDINVFYQRFANNNEVSYAEARQMLTAGQLKEFKWSVEEYIQKGRENAIDQRWMKELENASIRVRMSRLEALQMQMKQQVELLSAKRQTGTQAVLGDIYKDNYYHSIFELQKGTGLGSSFAKLDDRQVSSLLSRPWAPDGMNFSARIWGDRNKLVHELQTNLVQGLIRGDSSEMMIDALSKRMGVSRSYAERLVLTESAYFSGQSRIIAYKEMNVDEYKYTATLDLRTSSKCKGMDGKVFPLSEAQAGVNYPPLHAHCRSTTIPYYEDNVKERVAQDKDGKTYEVPGDITYSEWEKKYVASTTGSTNVPESGIIDQISYRNFTNAAEVKTWEQQVTPDWIKSLTANERSSIAKYTGSAYLDINKHLREGSTNDYYQGIVDNISSGLQKFELNENIIVHRGLNRNIFNMPIDELPGTVITEAAFMSTSVLSNSSFGGYVRMELNVPRKARGAFINPLSDFEDTEYEYLLDKETSYVILEATEKNGQLILKAEVIVDDGEGV